MCVTHSPSWKTLFEHAKVIKPQHLKELLNTPEQRFDKFSFQCCKLLLDLSKQRMTEETLQLLIQLAKEQQLEQWIERLFSGEAVNLSENRPALHTALREPQQSDSDKDSRNSAIHASLDKLAAIVEKIHQRQWRGYNGSPIKHIVNIGVGGSDLGPLMACRALRGSIPDQAKDLEIHFVSSMDGSQLATLLHKLDPASTLFIISSKSFSTIDTLANAKTAREWLINSSGLNSDIINQHHFIGVTTKPEKAEKWGIPQSNQLLFWDWTGGRYSMWSVIGLPIALSLGMDNFRQLLAGAHGMDTHFRNTPLSENIPVLLGLAGVWNINFLDIHAHAILPYDGRLAHFPAYLEQLEMESNGKSSNREGEQINYHTCPIIWGEIGPNAQHAFYQLLHQGTESVMCDFIAPAVRYKGYQDELQDQHQLALANCFAQSQLLALGDSILDNPESSPGYKRYHGNQPSTTIILDSLNPESLGALIALYEHKVFVQSVIWEINPFDQWGVELGKEVATSLLPQLSGSIDQNTDCSTAGLIQHINRLRNEQASEANS